MRGIGSPEHLIENFLALEEAGVDQLILLQQCGNYRHGHICKSLELFGTEVLPQFKAREAKREQLKHEMLGSSIADARLKIQKLEQMTEIPPVEAYPLIWNRMGSDNPQGVPDRRPGMTALWQMQVGGKRSKK